MDKLFLKTVLLSAFMLLSFLAEIIARPVLPVLFTTNMVLQQNTNAPIWGSATPYKSVKITTSWNNKVISIKADAKGSWRTVISTPSAGGPYEIKISDGSEIKLTNVMIGEVWICSGQSNMEMPLGGWGQVNNYKQEISNANYPDIRLLQIKKTTAPVPSDIVNANTTSWNSCSPSSVENFSAVAYFYARELNRKLNIPIGVIDVTWGGTPIEAWTSGRSLSCFSEFKDKLEVACNYGKNMGLNLDIEKKERESWISQCEAKDQGLINKWYSSQYNADLWSTMPIPQYMEKTLGDNFDGIVWFRNNINIPENWVGNGNVSLELGPIDDEDICYFNGVEIGRTSGFNVNRHYIIPKKLIKTGDNNLTIRVYDSGGEGGIYGKVEQIYLTNGSEKMKLNGYWKYNIGANQKQLPAVPVPVLNNSSYPSSLYNAMIHPLISFAFQGVIWYQGEANENRGYQYRDLFSVMIRDWRRAWNRNFPFYFVQLANYKKQAEKPGESNWAEVREAQSMALNIENTGMAVITDIGESSNIHPKNKQEVARRLSLIALTNTYKNKGEYSGPKFKSYCIKDNKIEISFTHSEGLKAKAIKLQGFAIAGPDHIYYNADAEIVDGKVVVFSPKVEYPVAVRYDWADSPECTLFNSDELPASSFRTDDWPGITYNVK